MQEGIELMHKLVKQFGQKVRAIRIKKKLSQGDVAKLLHVHPTYISSMERGVRNPSLLTMHKIAKALKIDLKELL